ncbi:hypothetical protein [Fictibacillus norfolkensis]|uniref:Uncharacterized protein n=1 Tax=Fictibacillus norfolkensis TaxID=2762233 RepID=A0ABR8SRZ3_9BACL|nr:hypothetical protein [Fictibacillus norfolkensis]MBD7966271.1 hypothetical protein [Fictibacillus norfolkensis]
MIEQSHSKLYEEKIINQYSDLIELMYSSHILFTGKWLSRQSGVIHFNLKKTEVRTIISSIDEGTYSIQKDFYDYMINYKGELIRLYVDIINEIKQKYDVIITGRIKNEDSIFNKLEKKSNELNGLDSHEIYKKDYTSWPEIYNRG